MNPTTPGIKTTELAVTVGTVVASLLVTFGVISAAQGNTVATSITDAITGAIALAVIYGIVSQYIKGRNDLKMAQLTGQAPLTIVPTFPDAPPTTTTTTVTTPSI